MVCVGVRTSWVTACSTREPRATINGGMWPVSDPSLDLVNITGMRCSRSILYFTFPLYLLRHLPWNLKPCDDSSLSPRRCCHICMGSGVCSSEDRTVAGGFWLRDIQVWHIRIHLLCRPWLLMVKIYFYAANAVLVVISLYIFQGSSCELLFSWRIFYNTDLPGNSLTCSGFPCGLNRAASDLQHTWKVCMLTLHVPEILDKGRTYCKSVKVCLLIDGVKGTRGFYHYHCLIFSSGNFFGGDITDLLPCILVCTHLDISCRYLWLLH